jgi:hypothetical protein
MLSIYLLMGKVGGVSTLSRFLLCLCIAGGGLSALAGCSIPSSKASSLAQVEALRQQTASLATNNQQREEPTSLEMFNAFLDRG